MATVRQTPHTQDPVITPGMVSALTERPMPATTMTYEEFLEWIDEDTHAEWVDGEVVMASPAAYKHQDLALFLSMTLSLYIRVQRAGKVLLAPFQMKLARSGREPDLLFVATEHLDRITPTFLHGAADLAVEIVSPDSIERDRVKKRGEYEEAGIPEYWVLDPREQQATFYQLESHGHYRAVAPDAEGIYRSLAVPGFWVRVDWLWQEPLPDVTDVLLAIAPDVYAAYMRERLRQAGR